MAGETTSKRPWRSSLGTRIFLATALLVALAVTVAVVVTSALGNRIARGAVETALERSSAMQSDFQRQQIERLRLMAQILAGDPSFSAYIVESLALGDAVSILDQLEERRGDLGFDFAVLIGPDNRVVARTDDPNARGENLSDVPLVRQAMEEYEGYGVWSKDGELFYAVAVPLSAGSVAQALLLLCFEVNDAMALELRRITDTEVAFFLRTPEGPGLVSTTLESRVARDLQGAVREDGLLTQAAGPRELSLGNRRWLTLVRPLEGAAGEGDSATMSLASLEEQLQPYRRIESVLALVGLGAILLASIVSYLLPHRVLTPVRELAVAAQAAAEGDYDQEITSRRGDEVGQLSHAFNTLLAELREKRDMEVYISELARNLPEPSDSIAAGGRFDDVRRCRLALLGVEIRGGGGSADGVTDPEEVMDRLARDLGFISATVATHSGTVLAAVGYRVLVGFEGERPVSRAVSAGSALLGAWRQGVGRSQVTTGPLDPRRPFPAGAQEAPAAAQGEPPPALALVLGEAVTGPLSWGGSPQSTVLGRSVMELEGLLRVAKPGDFLLARSTYEDAVRVFREAGVDLEEQPGFSQSLPVFAMDPGLAARVNQSDVAATWDSKTASDPTLTTLAGINPGTRFGERFEILSILGAGGMGVVYKARDRKLDELVALKMLKHGWGDDESLERLKSELKLARRISHVNVLRTYDFGEVNTIPFISMEYVRGITLRKLLDQSGRLPLSAGLRLARQLCRGLEAAHGQGVLHRDIKPENLLIEPTGNVKLMDFGIARPLHTTPGTTQPGFLVGTPYYLAPEQIQGADLDARADIYACGVVFYEIFTAELPFSREGGVMQILTRRTEEDPVPPRTYWEGMPEALEAVILKCLARERENRWPNVRTLLAELETLRV